MKKNGILWISAAVMALSLWGCGEEVPEQEENKVELQEEISGEEKEEERGGEEQSAEKFSFGDFRNLEFSFCSGAGGWATLMNIREDGSFFGEYFDNDMGETGDGYSKGIRYQCDFSGQFTEPVKVNDYTYSMKIETLNYEEEVGKEEILDEVLYCYSDAYGLDGAEEILIYLPGAPLSELPEEYKSWVGVGYQEDSDTQLPFYGLYNVAEQEGFSSSDMVEVMKENITYAEQRSEELEDSIRNDGSLSQGELNEKSYELYQQWDSLLNRIWDILKKTKDGETMKVLTAEEREWIRSKEAAAAEAGKEFEGGSLEPMVRNQKAAELTRERVYELLELMEQER